jgi:ribosome-associated protein
MFHVIIPEEEIRFKFTVASGPGGQNVNRRTTKVQLWWDIGKSKVLNEEQKMILRRKLAHKINKEDELFMEQDSERSQERNKDELVKRIYKIVNLALKPKKKRKKTRVPLPEKERRLEEKRHQSIKN